MTIQSILCVFGGSPEQANALNAALTLAELDQPDFRLLHIPAEPDIFADLDDEELDNPSSLAARLGELIGASDASPTVIVRQYVQVEDNLDDEADESLESRSTGQDAEDELEEPHEDEDDLRHEMANAIVDVINDKGVCLLADLEADGFTAEEIIGNWSEAQKLAKTVIAEQESEEEDDEVKDILASPLLVA